MPGDRGVQPGDQLGVLDQLGAVHHRRHQPEIDAALGEDLSDPGQPLTQRDRIVQAPGRAAPTDAQRGRHLGDHVLVSVDRPIETVGVVVRRPTRIQLADRRQLARAVRVLRPGRRGDAIQHTGVVDALKRQFTRHCFEHTFDNNPAL